MKKNTLKKLALSRETLRSLSPDQALAAAGGVVQETSIVIDRPLPLTTDSVRVCCA